MDKVKTNQLCVGDRQKISTFLDGEDRYYVYILRRPDRRPFYIGKGVKLRVLQHETEACRHAEYSSNPYKINVIQKIRRSEEEIIYEIDSLFDDQKEAYDREAFLIDGFGRLHEGGPLTNLAAGGGSTAGPAPLSKERHQQSLGGIPDDDPDKAVINKYLLSIGKPKSICIKVLGRSTKPKPTQKFTHASRKQTKRQALALVASAAAEGIELADGCIIPRRFVYSGITAFIENGVSNDIVTSNMAKLVNAQKPLEESFVLCQKQISVIIELLGKQKLIDMGIL